MFVLFLIILCRYKILTFGAHTVRQKFANIKFFNLLNDHILRFFEAQS